MGPGCPARLVSRVLCSGLWVWLRSGSAGGSAACRAAVCSAAVPFSVVASTTAARPGVGVARAASMTSRTPARLPDAASTISGEMPLSDAAATMVRTTSLRAAAALQAAAAREPQALPALNHATATVAVYDAAHHPIHRLVPSSASRCSRR